MQVPAHFEYERATSVDHALALLAKFGPESRLLAGGHSLIPMMKLRLAQPETLIDINDLTELSFLRVTAGELRIGSMTRHAELLAAAEAGRYFPILHDAERRIADPVVRNRGTVGGSLCQADPSEDLSAAFAAIRATMIIQGPEGTRTVPAREFHTGPYETVVGPGELLTEIRVPILPGGGSAYVKVDRRAGDWPVGAAGAALWLDGETIAEAGIGLAAVGAPHFSAAEAEDALRGAAASEESFAQAGRIAAEHCRPLSDQRGPADYKRHLAAELTVRALRLAAARVRGDDGADRPGSTRAARVRRDDDVDRPGAPRAARVRKDDGADGPGSTRAARVGGDGAGASAAARSRRAGKA
jgi:aerobic carbon-monoxide dehydrogenase medium subunit